MEWQPTILTAAVNAAKNGTRDLIAAPGANKSLWIYGIMGTGDAAGTILLLDSTPTSHSGVMPVPANGGFVLPISINAWAPWIKCATNKKFQITLAATNDFDGIVVYAIIDAAHGG